MISLSTISTQAAGEHSADLRREAATRRHLQLVESSAPRAKKTSRTGRLMSALRAALTTPHFPAQASDGRRGV